MQLGSLGRWEQKTENSVTFERTTFPGSPNGTQLPERDGIDSAMKMRGDTSLTSYKGNAH